MSIALYTLTSWLHQENFPETSVDPFITEIEDAIGEKFVHCGGNFATYGDYKSNLIYVRTGGTEEIFRALGLSGKIKLLTSGKRNSLAAAMEILSYINERGGKGEIIHGSTEEIAERIKSGFDRKAKKAPKCRMIKDLPSMDFGKARLGVIGNPSDWLISSDVDYARARKRLGLEIVDIPMSELLEELSGFTGNKRSFKGSEAIYDALKVLISKHNLSGLTLRCFDLLDSFCNTGCLALARLNAEGIPAACEGDIPSLISMMIAKKLTGYSGFQANLSRVNGDEFLFAHCTVALNMVTSYTYDTHFESGLGTAIKGELPLGEATILKVSPDLKKYIAIPAEIIGNQSEPSLCRTQIIVRAKEAAQYFLTQSLANHHIIVPGRITL